MNDLAALRDDILETFNLQCEEIIKLHNRQNQVEMHLLTLEAKNKALERQLTSTQRRLALYSKVLKYFERTLRRHTGQHYWTSQKPQVIHENKKI